MFIHLLVGHTENGVFLISTGYLIENTIPLLMSLNIKLLCASSRTSVKADPLRSLFCIQYESFYYFQVRDTLSSC